MISTTAIHDAKRHLPTNELEDLKISLLSKNLMERENFCIRENRINNDNLVDISESSSIWQRRLSKFNPEKQNAKDGGKKTLDDERTLGLLNSCGKDLANFDGLEIKHKTLDNKKRSKQVKAKIYNGLEKELNFQTNSKSVGKKSADLPFLENLGEMESDKKVQESINIFIRQTIGCEQYMSFTNRPGDKPLQRIIEHQHAMEKCVKSLKVDIEICDGLENNTNMEPHQTDIEKDRSSTKEASCLERGFQADQNQQTIKSNVPQTVVALAAAAAKNPDLPGWPLLPPSKMQLQKCEKCSCEFFSPLNHRRHTRTHHWRINHVDKEELTLKRKNIAAFWDKLNHNEMQQIFANLKKCDLEDLPGEAVVSNLIALKEQINLMTFPPLYVKAGQDLLDILDNNQRIFPLSSKQILSILDESSERTFLCFQGDVNKIGLEEKNLVASLSYIVEQTLVKAWMVDKDAEALRNQQELFKEEETAQLKMLYYTVEKLVVRIIMSLEALERRVKNVARKKKKKEKTRQKGLKERKIGAAQLALNSEENESVDGENPSPEIVEEDNSPSASSTSMNSSGLENQLLELPKMEVNTLVQDADRKNHNIGGEEGRQQKSKDILSVRVTFKEVTPDFVDEDRVQQSDCNLGPNGEEGERFSKPPFNQGKVEDHGTGCRYILEQDDSAGVESHKRTPWRPYKESVRFDYNQDFYNQRASSWVLDPRFQYEGIQQNSYRTLRKPSTGTQYNTTNIESPVPGFYRGKPTNLRGTVLPFPTTQQWAKKAQTTSASLDRIIKDGTQEDGNLFHEHDSSESNMKDSVVEHVVRDAVLARETDTINSTSCISKAEKEPELRAFEKKELLSAVAVPSVAKVVASSIPNASFNLNVNSEDWPPLSNSRATYYPKSTGRYPLTSYQCESVNKLNSDHRGGGYQAGLDSSKELEGSILSGLTPSARGPVNYNTTGGLVTVDRHQKRGIMIGSVSVPLGDYVHLSKFGLGSTSRRNNANTPLRANQSYTSVLAAPPIRYTRVDPVARQQKTLHEGMSCLESDESLNMQIIDSYGGLGGHYKSSSLKSTSSMNFDVRHVKEGPTSERPHMYQLGDQRGERGVLPKQPLWLGGPARLVPQKVWRPVRSTTENIDPSSAGGGTDTEGSLINKNEKKPGNEGSINNAVSSQSEGMQVWDTDISRVAQCPIPATDTTAKFRDGNGVLNLKSVKENAPQNVTKNFDNSMVLNTEHLQCRKEISQDAFVMSKDDSENAYPPMKYIAMEQNTKCTFHNKNDNTESIEDKAYVENALSHSAWIAEAVEFHLSRWHSALKDPETVVSKCEEEHLELQSSVWIDFMESLPSIATRLTLRKEDACDGNDQFGPKTSKNITPNEQTSTNAHNSRHEGSGAASNGEELRDPSSACESGSPSGVGSAAIGPTSGSQNYGRNHDSEGRTGSRCDSSCSDSSMSSNSRAERRDWTVTATRERLQEKRYMPKQGCPEEKRRETS